jgi:hypothetical protein
MYFYFVLDADSLISTLCYAYLKQESTEQSATEPHIVYVPAAGVSRDDLALRRDVQLAVR